MAATLRITVLSASGLQSGPHSHPYVVLSVIGNSGVIRAEFKTKPVAYSTNCVWDDEFEWRNYSPNEAFRFSVMDQGLLGSATLQGPDFFPHGYEGAILLTNTGTGINARLQVKVAVHGAGAPVPTSIRDNRPPEPKPDMPIGSIGSFSSVSPLSVTGNLQSSFGMGSGSRSPPFVVQIGSGSPSYQLGSFPQTSPVGSFPQTSGSSLSNGGIQIGSYQVTNPMGEYASLASIESNFVPGPRPDPYASIASVGSNFVPAPRPDPFSGSFQASQPHGALPSYGSVNVGSQQKVQSYDSLHIGSQPRVQVSESLQSRLIPNIGSAPPSRLLEPIGSTHLGYQSTPYGSSLEIGSYPKVQLSGFPQSQNIGSLSCIPSSLSDAFDTSPADQFSAPTHVRPHDQSIEIGSHHNSPQRQQKGLIASIPNEGSIASIWSKPSYQDRVRLKVLIKSAHRLRNADIVGKSDPYVVCHSDGLAEPFQTKVINNDLNPVWNHTSIVDYKIGHPLIFDVLDDDSVPLVGHAFKQDDFLGRLELPSEVFFPDGLCFGEMPLDQAGTGIDATLDVEIVVLDSPSDNFDTTPADIVQSSVLVQQPPNTRQCSVQRLQVIIKSARGLANADMLSKSDPYVVCYSEGFAEPIKTKVIDNDLNPVWNHTAVVNYDFGKPLIFEVYDDDSVPLVGHAFGQDNFLGQCQVDAERFFPTAFQGEIPLARAGVGIDARLKVEIRVLDPASRTDQPSRVNLAVLSASGLMACTVGSRSECYVQAVDKHGNVLLQTKPVLELDCPVWNFEKEVIQDGPVTFQVRDQEQLLGFAELAENMATGEVIELTLLRRDGNVTRAKLKVQVFPASHQPDHGTSTISITVQNASLTSMDKNRRVGDNPGYVVLVEAGDRSASFETPMSLSSMSAAAMPVWNYKSQFPNYRGAPIEFTIKTASRFGAPSDVLGRASLRTDQFYPFGFEGEVTVSDPKSGGGILGLLRLQVAIPGRSLPQAPSDSNTMVIPAHRPITRSSRPSDYSAFAPLSVAPHRILKPSGSNTQLLGVTRSGISFSPAFDGSGLNVTYKPGSEIVIAGRIINNQALPRQFVR